MVVGIAVILAMTGFVRPVYVFAPLLGLAIWRVGYGSLASLRAGGTHIPDGPPQPVNPAVERVVYWCDGCGAELLLLARGAEVAPRHCGERMTERRETPASRQ
jgi:DNA-directed RNA polymerase subunit RPC12/RpoP